MKAPLPRIRTFLLVLGTLACDAHSQTGSEPVQTPHEARSELARKEAKTQAPGKGAPRSTSYRRASAGSVVAIGDLHGDLAQTRKVLQLAGAIDASDHWIGGNLVIVQTGDAIDRGDDDREVLDLIERLKDEAGASGGALIALSGNHEIMNVAQDFRYVSRGSVAAFDNVGGRVEAFKPGGPYARMLAKRPVVVQVGDAVFVHGGVLMKHVEYGLDRINQDVRAFMLGEPADLSLVMAEDGPVWTRVYSGVPEPACAELAQVLSALGARRMIVGHTVQPNGINSACDGRVWRIDVGLAQHYGGPVQALQIKGDVVKPLSAAN